MINLKTVEVCSFDGEYNYISEQDSFKNDKVVYRILTSDRAFTVGFFEYDNVEKQYLFRGTNTQYSAKQLLEIIRLIESI